jgi:hypothetical protein
MTDFGFLLVTFHVTGLLIGGYISWRVTWLKAYRLGLADSREIWTRAMDEAHAAMLQNIEVQREHMVATFTAATKAGKP